MLMAFGTLIKAAFVNHGRLQDMKVSTNLHSGNFIGEASQAADQLYGEVTNFVSTANQSADEIRKTATEFANSAWSTVSKPFMAS